MNMRTKLLLIIVPLFFSSCSEDNPVSIKYSMAGIWKVKYSPDVGVEFRVDKYAMWDVKENGVMLYGIVTYTDEKYEPCSCPRDTLDGDLDVRGHFTLSLGADSTIQIIKDTAHTIVFEKILFGTLQRTSRIFDGENRWIYSEKSYRPPDAKNEIFASWIIHGIKE